MRGRSTSRTASNLSPDVTGRHGTVRVQARRVLVPRVLIHPTSLRTESPSSPPLPPSPVKKNVMLVCVRALTSSRVMRALGSLLSRRLRRSSSAGSTGCGKVSLTGVNPAEHARRIKRRSSFAEARRPRCAVAKLESKGEGTALVAPRQTAA